MLEGQYLGQPPVNVRRGGARRLHFSLMRGVSSYSGAAGGFGQVPAFPPSLQRIKGPQVGTRDQKMVELYAAQPGLFKQRLESQFRVPRARVSSGTPRPLIPQVGPNA